MARVLLTDYAWPDASIERETVERAGHELACGPAVASPAGAIAALCRELRPTAILTCWAPVDAAAIGACPDLRVVARMGVGLDNIDVRAATDAGAWVTNVPDYCVEEVSDHALALILAWARGVARFDAAVKGGTWDPAGARLRRVRSLTAGIVGLGRIGRATARKLRGIGVRVVGFDPVPPPPDVAAAVGLEELLATADVVVLHLPLSAATHHFINAERLHAMKPGALLVNVSRGPLVDTDALLAALRAGRISAALDVVEGEPNPPRELLARDDVLVTPHVAFSSDESVRELRARAAAEVVRVLRGEPPQFPCNAPSAARA